MKEKLKAFSGIQITFSDIHVSKSICTANRFSNPSSPSIDAFDMMLEYQFIIFTDNVGHRQFSTAYGPNRDHPPAKRICRRHILTFFFVKQLFLRENI